MNESLYLVVDMYGCPNRCKHCWLGHATNITNSITNSITISNNMDSFLIDYFKNDFESITYYSWLRETDFTDDYKARWFKDLDISINTKPIRFELASFYRLSKDKEYVKFLKEVGVEIVQLAFFGLEDKTDYYVGRKGAFKELLKAIDILIENGISPRIQIFINEDNKDDISPLISLFEQLNIKKKVEAMGKDFNMFITVGTCDGENEKLYNIRLNKESIPSNLINYFINYEALKTERELALYFQKIDNYFVPRNDSRIVLNISNELDVYFNFTHMKPEWKIGNVLTDDKKELIRRIKEEDIFALNVARMYTISELVKEFADFNSNRLFEKDDYLMYLLNQKVRKEYEENDK